MSFVDSFIYHNFRDISIFHPLFGLQSQIMTSSVIALLHNFFMMLKSWAENLKYSWRSYKDFGMYNMWAEYFKKSTRSSQSCNFGKILQCWKNLGMFSSSRFWDIIFSTLFNTYVYRRVSFRAVDIIISKQEEICGPKILTMETTIFIFVWSLAVWRLSRNQFKPVWAETVKNYPAWKLELLSPQNR